MYSFFSGESSKIPYLTLNTDDIRKQYLKGGQTDLLGSDETACLTIHGLRAQGSRYEKDLGTSRNLVADDLLCAVRPLKGLQLDAGVLLNANTLSSATVVVKAGLAILGA